jgi:hypothetical protein
MPVVTAGARSMAPRHWIENSGRLAALARARSVDTDALPSGVPPRPPDPPPASLVLDPAAAPPAPLPPLHHPCASSVGASARMSETAAIQPSR